MNQYKRIIARLDIKGNKVIKGVRFEGLRVVGDPEPLAKSYFDQGIDELLLLDSVASLYGRTTLPKIISEIISSSFIPVTAGGGISSVEDARLLLRHGADKIAINTAALRDPQLLRELSDEFGKQCVVLSIQAKLTNNGSYCCMTNAGRDSTGINPIEWIQKAEDLGIGEVLLTSVDFDGTQSGTDLELIKSIMDVVNVPLIYSGGFCKDEDLQLLFNRYKGLDAIAIGSSLHYNKITIDNLKKNLGPELSSSPSSVNINFNRQLNLEKENNIDFIGILDYGMGNIASVANALRLLNLKFKIISKPEHFYNSSTLILPGVGAFPSAMQKLQSQHLDSAILEFSQQNKPIIGICLGMQLLFETSFEKGITKGLSLLEGEIVELPQPQNAFRKTLNIGWKTINFAGPEGLCVVDKSPQYFVHSYYAKSVERSNVIYTSDYYDFSFPAVVKSSNIWGIQFHPERSGMDGIKFLNSILTTSQGD